MNIKYLIYVVSIIIVIMLQSFLLDEFTIFNVKPNLYIVLIVSFSLVRKRLEPIIIGTFLGIAQDVISGKVMGLYTLFGLYLSIIVAYFNKKIYRDGYFVAIIFVVVATLVYETAIYYTFVHWGSGVTYLYALRYIILPESILNMISTLFIHMYVLKISRWVDGSSGAIRRY